MKRKMADGAGGAWLTWQSCTAPQSMACMGEVHQNSMPHAHWPLHTNNSLKQQSRGFCFYIPRNAKTDTPFTLRIFFHDVRIVCIPYYTCTDPPMKVIPIKKHSKLTINKRRNNHNLARIHYKLLPY